MTQRDIAKDKEYVKYVGGFEELEWPLVMECCYIAQHYIDQYEAAQARFEIAFENNVRYIGENERLQARITELEALLHTNNNPGARKPQTHAQMMSDAIDKLASYEREGKR